MYAEDIMSLDWFGHQLRNPALSASLVVALAATAAGIFTIATSAPAPEINRAAKSDRAMAERDLSSLIFNAQPVAARQKLVHEPEYFDPSRRTMTEQILPARQPQEERQPPNGCESGLSPDIAPAVTIAPSRCVTQRKTPTNFASLR
jgi:hypothetical protein